MRMMIVFGGALWVAMGASASAQPQPIYRCTIKDGVTITDGQFVRDKSTSSWTKLLSPTVIDTHSGVVRIGDGPPESWTIAQQQDSANDFVATADAPYATDTLRVRAWQTPILFYRSYNGFSVYSGTCEVIK